jgi:hypothetical protein
MLLRTYNFWLLIVSPSCASRRSHLATSSPTVGAVIVVAAKLCYDPAPVPLWWRLYLQCEDATQLQSSTAPSQLQSSTAFSAGAERFLSTLLLEFNQLLFSTTDTIEN